MSTDEENELYRKIFQEHFGAVKSIWWIDGLLFVIAMIGLMMNVFLLFVTCYKKRPRAVDVMLICVIATFDIVWCSTLLVSLILRWSSGDNILSETSKLCRFSAITFNASFICTVVCTSILALARYLAIVHKLHLSNWIWMGTSLTLLSIVWILFIQRGFTEILFVMPAGFYCFPQVFGDDSMTKFFEVFMQILMYPSFVLLPVCYILITLYYRRHLTLLHPVKNHRISSKLNRGTIHLLIFLFAYTITIFSDFIHIMLSTYYGIKRTALSDGIVMSLEFTVSIINAIFALLMHDEIQSEFRALLGFYPDRISFPYTA